MKRFIFVFLLLICCRGYSAESSLKIISSPEAAAQYSIWQLDFSYPAISKFSPAVSRFDAVVTGPQGKSFKKAAYYNEDKDGKGFFRLRICPELSGLYQVKLFYVSSGKSGLIKELSFTSRAAEGRGFLRVSQSNKNYLQFSNGEGYFALGFNVCWSDSKNKLGDYLRYLDLLEKNGCNYTRLWLCTWGFSLETERPYVYNMKSALQLDKIFAEAQKRGIYIKLCFMNFHDFVYSPDKGPYLSKYGPCRNGAEFFLKKEAKDIFKSLLRYAVARYGAYRSLYGWELWNEIFYTRDNISKENFSDRYLQDKMYEPWTQEMAKELKKIDPYRHPVTTSLGMNESWTDIWNMPEIDLVQYHTYLHYYKGTRLAGEVEAPYFLRQRKTYINFFKKPYLMSEFGFVGTNEYNPLNDLDKKGLALHNSIWASSFQGYSGCAMHWWWDNYIDKNKLYYHYNALSKFFKDTDWSRKKIYFAFENDRILRILGMKTGNSALFWLQDRRTSWYRVLEEKARVEPVAGFSFALSGFRPGVYILEWFDTRKGKVIETAELKNDTGVIKILIPTYKYDIAARLFVSKDRKKQ
ncbi:MAG: cellulase family glycosylhydrolase [Planctomycetota bacterium]